MSVRRRTGSSELTRANSGGKHAVETPLPSSVGSLEEEGGGAKWLYAARMGMKPKSLNLSPKLMLLRGPLCWM